MQQVEAAVGEADPQPLAAPALDLVERVRPRHHLVGAVEVVAVDPGGKLARVDDRGSDLADDDAGGDVGEPRAVDAAPMPAPSAAPSVATTVSPAPETS